MDGVKIRDTIIIKFENTCKDIEYYMIKIIEFQLELYVLNPNFSRKIPGIYRLNNL